MNITVVKIGGNVIDDEDDLKEFLELFSKIGGAKVLVHGGGKLASRLGVKLGIKPQMVDGRRITDQETLDIVTMVYGGLVNKNLVASLQGLGCNALGLTGADGNIIESIKRPVKQIDYGFVGDVVKVNAEPLLTFLNAGIIPVIAPLTHDVKGQLLNTNADTMATVIAIALAEAGHEVSMRYCFEKVGVMKDVNDDGSLIQQIDENTYKELIQDEIIVDGMLPKLHNAFMAVNSGVLEVYLGKPSNLLSEKILGTKIIL